MKARDKAILDAVRNRPWTSDALLAVLPDEGHSAEQRRSALSSALIRLRVKKAIRAVEEGWVAA